MTSVTSLANGLFCIDLEFQGDAGVISCYLFERGSERVLIEIGPTSTLRVLLQGLDQLGVEPESISKVLVTHIHLDHAGASGAFIQRFPQAHLYVHEVGAPHMADPGRLLESAKRIYGDRMDSLWGDFQAVPEGNIHSLQDGDSVQVGDISLDVLYTPGHASHHVAFYDREHNACFTGDVAAVRLQGFDYVRPPTPPPDLNLPQWKESIDRLLALDLETLYLTHFGSFQDVETHLNQVPPRLEAWGDALRRGIDAGHGRAQVIQDLTRFGDSELVRSAPGVDPALIARYELATPYFMSVDGFLRYFKKGGRESQAP